MSENAARRRTALPDAAREGFRAHPRHKRPDTSDIAGSRETPFALANRTHQKAEGPPRLSNPSAGFLTQILGQFADSEGPEGPRHMSDRLAKGSDAYRLAGGEPAIYPSSPSVFRIGV